MCGFGGPLRIAAPWDPQGRISLCADRDNLVDLHCDRRGVQHNPLEPTNLPGPLPALHRQVLPTDRKRRLDLPWRDSSFYHW